MSERETALSGLAIGIKSTWLRNARCSLMALPSTPLTSVGGMATYPANLCPLFGGN
jgi:hypothetical protein